MCAITVCLGGIAFYFLQPHPSVTSRKVNHNGMRIKEPRISWNELDLSPRRCDLSSINVEKLTQEQFDTLPIGDDPVVIRGQCVIILFA